jgi:hypothetical protein
MTSSRLTGNKSPRRLGAWGVADKILTNLIYTAIIVFLLTWSAALWVNVIAGPSSEALAVTGHVLRTTQDEGAHHD